MKRSLMALAFLAGALAIPVNTAAQETPKTERDPGVTAMINELSRQFEEATGKPLDQETRYQYRIGLVGSLVQNIRENSCREVIYSTHKDGHDLRVHEDICRINDNFVLAPEELRAKPH